MDSAKQNADGGGRGSNRRGRRSREELLDAASRLMAERGYAATTVAALSAETGIPKSAIYHHFRSKGGLLSAVMARGAEDFFAAMPQGREAPPESGSARERLSWLLQRTGAAFAARSEFLRLHLLLLMSSEAADVEVESMIAQVRRDGREQMRRMIATAFDSEGAEVAEAIGAELEYFGVAGFDGAFIAWQAEPHRGLCQPLDQLASALAALGAEIAERMRR